MTQPRGNGGSGYEGPGHDGPGYVGPGYEGPGHDGPGYEGPGHVGPGYEGQGLPGSPRPGPGYGPQPPAGRPPARVARTVPPAQQPLRPAIALAIITLASAVLTLVGIGAAVALSTFAPQVDLDAGWLPSTGTEVTIWIIVVILVVLVVVAVDFGLGLASLILSILVVIRADGKLRIGAVLLLVMAAVNLLFSFTVEGIGGDTLSDVLVVINTVLQVLQWGVTLTGLVFLVLGIREVRRARAELRPGLR